MLMPVELLLSNKIVIHISEKKKAASSQLCHHSECKAVKGWSLLHVECLQRHTICPLGSFWQHSNDNNPRFIYIFIPLRSWEESSEKFSPFCYQVEDIFLTPALWPDENAFLSNSKFKNWIHIRNFKNISQKDKAHSGCIIGNNSSFHLLYTINNTKRLSCRLIRLHRF